MSLKTSFFARAAAAGVLAILALGATGVAQARSDVSWSVGIGLPGAAVSVGNGYGYVQPAPVYVQPAPVYAPGYVQNYAPPVAYVQPGYAPVYVAPRPVIYAPPVYVVPRPVYVQPGYYGRGYEGRGYYGGRGYDGRGHGYGHR